jgi:hypothetical protein
MFDVVGENAAQQMPRVGVNGGGTEKDVSVQKAERVREARPVEQSHASDQSQAKSDQNEDAHIRTRLEEGRIIVEKYDEDGKLVKKTPPGYLPFGEIA